MLRKYFKNFPKVKTSRNIYCKTLKYNSKIL